ncbi:MAG: hydantoinase B/oxoprolinase family protein [Vulcanimicrobiota bacterium]
MNLPFGSILCFSLFAGRSYPHKFGIFQAHKNNAPEGNLVNAISPFAVSAGNVKTSQRIVDTVLLALSQILPDRIPAASCGT